LSKEVKRIKPVNLTRRRNCMSEYKGSIRIYKSNKRKRKFQKIINAELGIEEKGRKQVKREKQFNAQDSIRK